MAATAIRPRGWRARVAAALAVAFVGAAVALLATVVAVSAHANVERAQPAADAALPNPPDRVTIRFTEPVAPSLSAIQVLDAAGARVDRDDSTVDASDPHLMSVSVAALADGTYTVFWRNVSTVDGHARRGTYVFYVGARPADAPASSADAPPLFTSPLDPVARWLVLLGGLVAAGTLVFQLVIARPAAAQIAANGSGRTAPGAATAVSTAALIERRLRRIVLIALALLLLASLAHAVIQAVNARDVSIAAALGEPIRSVIGGTRWGHLWLARIALAGAALVPLVAWWRMPPASPASRGWRSGPVAMPVLALALISGSLLTLSFASHGAVTPGVAGGAVMSDALHLLAAGAWGGGLLALAVAIAATRRIGDEQLRRSYVGALARRFTPIGVLGTGTLLITGLYSGWTQLVTWASIATPYGRLVVIKLLILLALVALGALNQRRLVPHLARHARAAQRLGWLVRVEVVLVALALLAAAMLTAIEPGRQTAAREDAAQGVRFTQRVDGTEIAIALQPGALGTNDVVVTLGDARGRAIENATHVGVRVQFVGADLGATDLTAAHREGGRYVAPDAQISVAGRWQLEVAISRPDALDARTAFRFDVGIAGAGNSRFEPSVNGGNLAWAWEVILLGGLVLVVTNTWWARERVARGITVFGVATVVVGIVMWFGLGHVHVGAPPAVTGGPINPFTPDAASVATGSELFQSRCVVCHGAQGLGDGPNAGSLNPAPANLQTHVPLHSDGELFLMVADGFPRTAMTGFRGELSDEQIWHIVNFLRTLEDPTVTGRGS